MTLNEIIKEGRDLLDSQDTKTPEDNEFDLAVFCNQHLALILDTLEDSIGMPQSMS